jgi:hypothetical protein
MADRREFLRALAKGVAYAAPVVYTLSTPRELGAVVTSGMIMVMNVQDSISVQNLQGTQAPWSTNASPTAPWAAPPPWQRPVPTPPLVPPGGGDDE